MEKLVLIIFGAFLVTLVSCNWARKTTALRKTVLELHEQLESIDKQLNRSVLDIFNGEYQDLDIDVHDALELHRKFLTQTTKYSKSLDEIFGKNITVEEKDFTKKNITCCEKLVKNIEQININLMKKLLKIFDEKSEGIARIYQPSRLEVNCGNYSSHKTNHTIMYGALVALNLEVVLLHIYENWASTFGNLLHCQAQIDRVTNVTREMINFKDRIPHKINICESFLIRRRSSYYQFFNRLSSFLVENKERLCTWRYAY